MAAVNKSPAVAVCVMSIAAGGNYSSKCQASVCLEPDIRYRAIKSPASGAHKAFTWISQSGV